LFYGATIKLIDLSQQLTQSQTVYARESDTQSSVGSLNNTDFEESAITKIPIHPVSEQTGKLPSI
jgi:hypothetical protein